MLYFILKCNTLNEDERNALNDMSNEWGLGWTNDLECPGDRNDNGDVIECTDDGHVKNLYLLSIYV